MTMGVSEPHVTVIVPSFNQARYVRDALDSIEHASDRPVHVHVVDGASTDGTVEILREYESMPRMTWTSRPDRGVHDAVNDGLRAARTPYCLVLSTDDALLPGSLDEGVEILLAEPQLAMVFGDAEYIDAAGRSQGIARAREACLGSLLAKSTFVIQGSALFRTERARLVGGFRPDRPYVCDSELWIRLALQWPVRHVPRVWSRYRYHPQQRDTQRERIVQEWWELVDQLRPVLSRRMRVRARLGDYVTEYRYGDPFSLRRGLALWRCLCVDPRLPVTHGLPLREFALPLRWCGSQFKRRALRIGRTSTAGPSDVSVP